MDVFVHTLSNSHQVSDHSEYPFIERVTCWYRIQLMRVGEATEA